MIGSDGKATTFGNAGAGIVEGPGQRNFDLSLLRKIPVRWPNEAATVEFRAELFNALNTPQFANPNVNFSSSSFGSITALAVNPRIIQLAAKLTF